MFAWAESSADVLTAFGRELAGASLTGPRARESWKAVCSVLLGVGMALALFESSDTFWAGFAAFMVLRAGTRETIQRGIHRVLGTVAGGLLAWGLAGIVGNSARALLLTLMAIAFVSVFQFQVSRYPYAWMHFGLTAVLVLTVTLSAPRVATDWVETRIGEVLTGVVACVLVSCFFAGFWPVETPAAGTAAHPESSLSLWRGLFDEEWLERHWLALGHAARGAVSVAVLFFLWRLIELEDIGDSSATAYLVLVVPPASLARGGETALTNRIAQRLVGCTLGGTFGLLGAAFGHARFNLWVFALAAGVWIAAWVQNGKPASSYAGSQFALGLIVTLVQGNGPPTDYLPPVERFRGILIGLLVLTFMQALWPLPGETAAEPAGVPEGSGPARAR